MGVVRNVRASDRSKLNLGDRTPEEIAVIRRGNKNPIRSNAPGDPFAAPSRELMGVCEGCSRQTPVSNLRMKPGMELSMRAIPPSVCPDCMK
jgi:hypothetical protein